MILILFLSACKDFLDEVQDNRATIDSNEKIGQLIASAYADAQYAEFAESMSDNADDKGPGASTERDVNRTAYLWEDFTANDNAETTTNYWEESYYAITHANHGLEAIKERGESPELDQFKGEALIARAYAHFMLANFFCMRYDPGTENTELGIPYAMEPEKNAVVKYERSSLKETYDRIEADIEEPKFHFTTKSANAFATRFYLYKGEWEKVIDHANRVLQENPGSLLKNFASQAYQSLSYSQRTIGYSSASEESNLLITWTYSVYGRNFASNRYALSDSIRNALFVDQNTNPFRKDWAYDNFGGTDFVLNFPKYEEYFRVTNIVSGIGFPYASLVHFTMEEVLLNRAEAYVMLGEFNNALSDLTAFLRVKTEGAASDRLSVQDMTSTYQNARNEYFPFYELTDQQAAFVKGIAEFRRREFYHEGLRWLDIKRFNIVVEHRIVGGDTAMMPKISEGELENSTNVTDDMKLTLMADDRRRAIQIPESAKAFGITPNKR